MERKPYPSETQERFIVRLPDGMRDRIAEAAKANNRSMNAEIVHMLQSHFDRITDEADDLAASLEKAERSNVSIGLSDPVDRAAVLKSLLLDELMLLRRRIEDLGGPESVLKMEKHEIVKKIEGPRIKGSVAEQKSLFSQMLPTYPLAALLTDGELDRLAERAIAMQQASAIKKK